VFLPPWRLAAEFDAELAAATVMAAYSYTTNSMMNTGPVMYSAGQAMSSGAVMASNAVARNSGFVSQGEAAAMNAAAMNGGMVRGGASRGCCGVGSSTAARYNGMAAGSNYGMAGAPYGYNGATYATGATYTTGPGGEVIMTSTGTGVAPGSGDPCGCGPGANAGECTGACGGMETMCCEPDGAATGVNWVKTSGGSYTPVTSYQYIGEGAGTYERQVVTTYYGWRVRKCCLCLLGLLLLAGLLYLLASLFNTPEPEEAAPPPPVVIATPAPTPAPVIVTTPRPAASKVCLIFGDPHAMTFDGQRADYYTPGEYWIVKSDTAWIQGKYQPTRMTNGLAVTKEVGIGGPFIGGHKMVISVDQIWWDGAVVQTGFDNLGATWQGANYGISFVYNDQGTIMQNSRAGKKLHVVHVTLPRGIKMEVNRWKEPNEGSYINVRIIMSPQPGQDGHCGNFNNVKDDDKRTAVRSRVGKNGVAENDLIFPGPKTVIKDGNRPDLNDCPEGELKIAMEKCKAAEKKFFPSNACLIDTCLGHLAPQGYR